MTNTTTTYLSIVNNLARYQKQEAQQPAVKTATAYYQANIGNVKTIDQFVGNYRLLSFALQANGLGDQIHNTALIRKVLEQGTTSSKALANTLPNGNWKAFAKAFAYLSAGTAAPSDSVATTTSDYVEQQLEADQGASDPGVELALYFKRVAPGVKDAYGILADKNLLQAVQTIFNLPPTASAAQIDKEANAIVKLVPLTSLQDPTKLGQLVERFTAAYDAKYGAASGSSSSLTVENGNATTTVTAASTILAGIVSSTALTLAQRSPFTPSINPALLSTLALGG